MMKRISIPAFAIVAAFAAPAFAQTPTADASAAKKAMDPNKVVCHTEEVTGSLLATKRECHTAAEWQEIQRQQRADVVRSQNGH